MKMNDDGTVLISDTGHTAIGPNPDGTVWMGQHGIAAQCLSEEDREMARDPAAAWARFAPSPLIDLAELNLRHWQSHTDGRSIRQAQLPPPAPSM